SGSSWTNITNANSASYTEYAVTAGMAGNQYRCVISGTAPCTSVTSNAATLTISTTAITSQPASTTICSNGTATFTIATSGTLPTYQWQKSTNGGSTWTDISGETGTSLVLSGLTSSNSTEQYRCTLNSGAINSDAAILTVYDVVAITTQPSNQTACSNASNATFSVSATGSGLTYQWQVSTNGGSTWASAPGTSTSSSYVISTLTNSLDQNKYRVIVSGSSPCTAVTSNAVTLSVTGVSIGSSASTVCANSNVTLTATSTSSSPSFTYSWSSTSGSGASTPITTNPAVITPTVAGSYTYTLTATATSGGCVITSTQGVTVNPQPAITSATATPTPICAGSTISLAAVINAIGTGNATLGTQSTTTLTGGPYRGGSCTANKTQFLITASELTSAGINPGNINSLTFVTTSTGSALANFSISMAHSSISNMTSTLESTGFTQVYSVASYTPISGNNTHTFSTPFNWNGTSNIIINVCHDYACNSSATMSMASPGYTATSYLLTGASGSNCTTFTGATTATTRPVMIFNAQVPTNNSASFNWSWNTTPAINAATGTTTAVNNTTSPVATTFTATATNPTTGCSSSLTTSTVTINPMPAVPTANSTSVCGTQNATCSVTGSGVGGNTFRWYTVATGGTAIVGQTGNSLTAYPVSTNTTFYVSEANANCESARVAVTQTVTVAPTISASALSPTICSGQSATLTASSLNAGYTYTWSNSLGTGSSVSVSPSATTSYTVTANDASGGANNGCSATANVTVTVNALPSAISITPSSTTICSGSIQALTASGGNGSTTSTSTGYSQGFESGVTDFGVSNNGTNTQNSTYFSAGTNSLRFNTATASATQSLTLASNVDLTNCSFATIQFSHIAAMENSSSALDYGFVQYSPDGGTTWNNFPVANYSGAASNTIFTANQVRFSTVSYTDWSSVITSSASVPSNSMWKTESFTIPADGLT
ncbi:MAG: hypothetical protein EBU01_08730, partial [Crocinitomicaceae bacterium]|nr:hypothetical protein [Crocinitomicaceae bacterium]